MSDQHGPSRPDPALYPDVAQAGDLRSALQAEFDLADYAWRVHHVPSPGWRYVAAEVRVGDRNTDVVMGTRERVFCLQFWARGMRMAHGTTGGLAAVARAIHTWQSGVRVRQLASAWPFVSTSEFAEAYERSDADAVDEQWCRYHDNTPPAWHLARLHPFIALAFREPRLRALLPYTSHATLCFSRTVVFPFSEDCPLVEPLEDGKYRVKAADGRELGTSDAAGSLTLVLTALDAESAR